ncbi:transposase domain-containing protein, partial [Ensifer adhaerens]|uniref:transposase domain-containing protein n=1 Tax=Ensifer adhaerens TaxID=106592 RepID=UPI003F860E0D
DRHSPRNRNSSDAQMWVIASLTGGVPIRPQTITRKNSLFAGSEGGGRTWATVATLLQTCKMNGVDPLDWLSQTLTRIAQGWPASEIEALMPWNFRSDAVS